MSHLALVADATPQPDTPAPGRYRTLRTAQRVPDPTPGWQDDALCREVDADMFFPEKGDTSAGARKVCDACPVRVDCLNYGLVHGGRDGVWGGMGQTQLAAERKRLGIPHAYIQVEIDASLFDRPDEDDVEVPLLSLLRDAA